MYVLVLFGVSVEVVEEAERCCVMMARRTGHLDPRDVMSSGQDPGPCLRLSLTGGPGLREIRDSDDSLNNILSLVFFPFSSDE